MVREMIILTDEGDRMRRGPSCGILYGALRDAACKLRSLAEKERELHRLNDAWDIDDGSAQ